MLQNKKRILKILLVTGIAVFIFAALLLTSCNNEWQSADLDLAEETLSQANVSATYAYYLSKDGTLYCAGADYDASAYVLYQEKKDGIVAYDVSSFGTMLNGGYYITGDHSLYIYNSREIASYGYTKKYTHTKILSEVLDASFEKDYFLWMDTEQNLYLAGFFGDKHYPITSPLLLAESTVAFCCRDRSILWVTSEGTLSSFGDFPEDFSVKLEEIPNLEKIQKIQLEKDCAILLCDHTLFVLGNALFLENGEKEAALIKIADNITDFDSSHRTLGAKTENGDFLLWGRIIAGSAKKTDAPHYEFVTEKKIGENVKSIFVWDSSAGYIDSNGKSKIFHSDIGWTGFYGNSTEDSIVGIYNTPRTWIKQNT